MSPHPLRQAHRHNRRAARLFWPRRIGGVCAGVEANRRRDCTPGPNPPLPPAEVAVVTESLVIARLHRHGSQPIFPRGAPTSSCSVANRDRNTLEEAFAMNIEVMGAPRPVRSCARRQGRSRHRLDKRNRPWCRSRARDNPACASCSMASGHLTQLQRRSRGSETDFNVSATHLSADMAKLDEIAVLTDIPRMAAGSSLIYARLVATHNPRPPPVPRPARRRTVQRRSEAKLERCERQIFLNQDARLLCF